MSKRQQHNKSFLTSLIAFISEPMDQNPVELKRAFKEQGLDYDELVRKGLQVVHSAEREERFAKAKEKRDLLLNLMKDVKADRYKDRRPDLVAAFEKIFSSEQASLAFFHKLESVNDEELREMLNEAEILEMFEKQARSEGN